MAFNKSKALEEAARLVSQRKLPQAIKQYQAVIEQDPQDLPLRNIVGDLLVREGNVREAVREFNVLAEAYTREGFILKAIAIYKKIVKLDADSPEPLLRLAELYAGQKFSHEANEQYAQALAICERRSLHDLAGQILRKLAARDPGNAVYLMRLAEFLQRSGQPQEACAAFIQAAEIAAQRKNISAASAALKKAAELEPGNPRVGLFRARLAAEAKDHAEVERVLRAMPGVTADVEARRMLLGAYLASGRFEDAAALAIEAFRAGPEGIDTLRQFTAHCLDVPPDAPALSALHHFGLLIGQVADTAFQRDQEGEILELMQQALTHHPEDAALIDLAAALCERAGEDRTPKTLLKMAGLGEAGLQANPAQPVLDEAAGKHAAAAPEAPAEEADAQRQEAHLREPAEANSPEAVEVDFSSEWAAFSATHLAPPPEAKVEPEPPREAAPDSAHDLAAELAPETAPGPPPEMAVSPSVVERPLPMLADELLPSGALPLPPDSPAVAYERPELSEEAEQAAFYLNSGFLGEAAAIISDLVQKYPGRPEILELQQQLETAGVERVEPAGAEEVNSAAEFIESDGVFSLHGAPGTFDEINPTEDKIVPLFPEDQAPTDLPSALEEKAVAPPEEHGPVFQPGSLLSDLAQELALALEETGEQGAGNGGGQPPHAQAGRSLFDASLEELLTELEPGQTAAPAVETPQTHYNLGVAFREMGLLDEAISEFQKVVKGRVPADLSPRFLEASSMLGNCFMEKQMPQIAVRWYSRALQVPGLEEEIALALTYDLASACEQSGDLKSAQERFAEVYSLNIDYRDVAEKIQLLSRSRPA